jgi:hypothetical protein
VFDPQRKAYDDLISKRNELNEALNNPLARSKLANVDEVREAASAYDRAVLTRIEGACRLARDL